MNEKMEILVQQYKIMIDSTMQVSNWRQTANNFYLTVNTVLLSVDTFLISFNPYAGLIVGVGGVLIAVLWRATILYYKDLNNVKFKIVHKIEDQLPVALFKDEWVELKKKHRLITPTRIETWVPIIFLIAYLFVIGSYLWPIIIANI